MTRKKIKYYLQHFDAIWSVPVLFCAFILFETVIHKLGIPAGTYDAGWFQPLLLSMAIVVGATNGAVGGLYFTFRGFYRYLYNRNGEKGRDAKDDWSFITPFQRIVIVLSALFAFMAMIILVFIQFI